MAPKRSASKRESLSKRARDEHGHWVSKEKQAANLAAAAAAAIAATTAATAATTAATAATESGTENEDLEDGLDKEKEIAEDVVDEELFDFGETGPAVGLEDHDMGEAALFGTPRGDVTANETSDQHRSPVSVSLSPPPTGKKTPRGAKVDKSGTPKSAKARLPPKPPVKGALREGGPCWTCVLSARSGKTTGVCHDQLGDADRCFECSGKSGKCVDCPPVLLPFANAMIQARIDDAEANLDGPSEHTSKMTKAYKVVAPFWQEMSQNVLDVGPAAAEEPLSIREKRALARAEKAAKKKGKKDEKKEEVLAPPKQSAIGVAPGVKKMLLGQIESVNDTAETMSDSEVLLGQISSLRKTVQTKL